MEPRKSRRSFDDRARRLRKHLRRFPALQPVVNKVGLWIWRRDLRRRARAGTVCEHAESLLSVAPRDIRFQIPLPDLPLDVSSNRDAVGWVLDGAWDAHPRPLDEHLVFQGIRERFDEGREWRETSLYRAARCALDEGRPLWKFRSEADLERLFSKIDALHETIAVMGYRSQAELGTDRLWDEILVAIDRRGRIHLIDGAHRLAVAQVLGVDRVPVLLGVRHAEWDGFRTEVMQYSKDRGDGTYQPLEHPDLAVVPYSHGEERWPLLEAHLGSGSGPALDIGANSGFFSHRLARAGFSVTAVERSEKECYILRRLVSAWDLDIRVIKGSIFDAILAPRYEVVLALNIFHHFFKTRSDMEKLERLLAGIRTRALFLETHQPEELQMRGAVWNPSPLEYARWVAERARLEEIEQIGEAQGRSLFRLSTESS